MKKLLVAMIVLLVTAALSGTASARARGYGVVFEGAEHAEIGSLVRER